MNQLIKQITGQVLDELVPETWVALGYDKIKEIQNRTAQLIVRECIGILETEIELVEGYKSAACNDFDVRWHEGKIKHFTQLVEKSKKHFGVEE
jgi:hypothetical protein